MTYALARLVCLFCLLFLGQAAAQPPSGSALVELLLLDPQHRPVSGAHVEVQSAGTVLASADTAADGRATLPKLPAQVVQVLVTKDGLQPQVRDLDLSTQSNVSLELTAVPAIAHNESITVKGVNSEVEAGSSVPTHISGQEAHELPSRPATVSDALPLLSGVVREPGGGIVISAAPEHRSAMIVNNTDVTDPATGQFGVTVPMDSVEALNVYQTAYLAEYGRFTSGLVSVETKRGGDKWKWDLNDPLPEFFIRSWHVRGLRTATPRLNFEGPLIAGKLFFSEGFEYTVRRTAVYTLPFPYNRERQQGLNSFSQLDWVISPKHLLTTTFHAAPQRLGFVHLDYFHPEPTTPDASTRNFTGTVNDHYTLWGGLLQSSFSTTNFDARVWGRGTQDLVITPTGDTGNYFAERQQSASRYSGRSTYSLPTLQLAGSHQVKIGSYIAYSSIDGQLTQRPVDILNANGLPLLRLTYPRQRQFDINDIDYAAFGQDHWNIAKRFSVDLGVRTESQQVSRAVRVAPRAGMTWSLTPDGGTVLRAGVGLFYEHVPLNVYCFNKYPDQVVTTYDAAGQPIGAPILYLNTLGQTRVRFPFVFQNPADGNFSPRSTNASIELEQKVTPRLNMRLRYLINDAGGIVILDPLAPDPTAANGALFINGLGGARYSQLETTARLRLNSERELYFSYAYSRARGDLNDFGNYLGSFPEPIIRPNQFGTLPSNLPHRFLAWGVIKLPQKFEVAPSTEIRSGFPYAVTDAAQNWVGLPYSKSYPLFVSIDARVARTFQVHPKYGIKAAISAFNLTNHFNPEAVHSNIADPAYGYFFGHRGRRYTADFDFVF